MKPARFVYLAPRSAEQAAAWLREHDGDARLLSGGQSLIPLMNFRLVQPSALIDLGRCAGLAGVRRDGDVVVLGAMTRQAVVEHDATVRACCPLVSLAMPHVGSPTIRHRGTIGGSLAHADRTAELPVVAVALGAEMVALGADGRRTIAAEAFFVGDLTTALRFDELLVEVRVPVCPAGGRVGFVEVGNRHHDLAVVAVAAYLELDGDVVVAARVVVGAAGPRPVRLGAVERRLLGAVADAAGVARAAEAALADIEPEGDLHASAAYRASVLPGLVARALRQALERSGT